MLNIDFYIYILLILFWLSYAANTFYQNYRMEHFFHNRLEEALFIPFYLFISGTSWIITSKLISFSLQSKTMTIDISPGFILMKVIGIIFCFASITLFTYISFFEKSFPSCFAIKSGKKLGKIYNYIRHPSYYIFFLITFGTAFSLTNKSLFILACINHISLYFYYIIEENQLSKQKNPYYDEYLKKTKRFFPIFPKSSI